MSFNWKNDQWNAVHFLWLYSKSMTTVFLCFTPRNWGSVISFNWKNDQWNAAHLLCFYIRESDWGSPNRGVRLKEIPRLNAILFTIICLQAPLAKCYPIHHHFFPSHPEYMHTYIPHKPYMLYHTIPYHTISYHTTPYHTYI